MNKAKLKSYAPQARKDFITAVTARANLLGLSEKAGKLEVITSQPQGDATVIAGQAWPVKVHGQRQQLITRIQKDGFIQTMEAVAYTWFNRFAALRYMELHDYLGHGHRALSSIEGKLPDILTHAADLIQDSGGNGGLPGVKADLVTEMQLAGNRDGELYRLMLVAQCNALSNVMPFLFERIDDETELLLPDNLLRTDSVIGKLVDNIEEDDWKDVEIIGWLYQFYISDKKDEVIGKVVQSDDIPAATQLFTPNWIVQYLVQNSIGRLWLMANPASTLKEQWPYYIVPAEQTPEVQVQIDRVIEFRVKEDGSSLNPESITLLDPACGSGHMLVEAYEVLKGIYLERGYQPRAIPRLILEKNLYGLDIDDRAAQLAGFALLMKARADDRRLLDNPIRLNVLSLKESKGLDSRELTAALQWSVGNTPFVAGNTLASALSKSNGSFATGQQLGLGESSALNMSAGRLQALVGSLIATFSYAKTYGSLIQIPNELSVQLPILAEQLKLALQDGDLYGKAAAQDLLPLVEQARVLSMQFDAVVANPPYMGGKGMNAALKNYAKATFPDSKSDLFSMFIERGFLWCKNSGFNSMVTMQSWMFLSSYETMREKLLKERTIQNMAHLGARAFSEISGEVVQTTAFVLEGAHMNGFKPVFFRLVEGTEEQKRADLRAGRNRFDTTVQDDFRKIPGSPVAYWVDPAIRDVFFNEATLGSVSTSAVGQNTGDNDKFLRRWYEVRNADFNRNCKSREETHSNIGRWYPYNKGGAYRKWFGNFEYVVNWRNDGEEIKEYAVTRNQGKHWSRYIQNLGFLFKEALTWSDVTSGNISARYLPPGFISDVSGPCAFFEEIDVRIGLSVLNSNFVQETSGILNPTIHFQAGNYRSLPYSDNHNNEEVKQIVEDAIRISKLNWDAFEVSWDFQEISWITGQSKKENIALSWGSWNIYKTASIYKLKAIEEKNNELFNAAYGIKNGLTHEVPESKVTLIRADREKDCQRLISYAIGCIMGRYSLDEPGLIYADAGNVGFDASRYANFPADADGIVPLTDELWFEDEVASRIREFLLAVWGGEKLAENLAWLGEGLGSKVGETPDETIRRYLADKFYKDHLQTYKKRPIYWLFSSGKQGAFQALIYMHRYHEGTLSRMRAEYVVPLTGKIQSRIEMLGKDTIAATSSTARNKLAKEVERLKKKHVELLAFDEKLRHYADMRITLDLDDGVKVNYGKFGDLLAEVKAVTGGANDD
jgi:type II restriction/modification system DNA methylase subunit YeeA